MDALARLPVAGATQDFSRELLSASQHVESDQQGTDPAQGPSGMRYSLPSRDLIADSIETIASAQHYDGLVTIMGCDKNMPGAMIAMSLPHSSSNPAASADKVAECERAGAAIRLLLERDLRPSDILTREAFENAITLAIAIGGSTNVVLHLLAIARTLELDLTIDDFQRISDRTPLLANFRPSGPYVMEDLYAAGGMPAVIRMLLEEGLLHNGFRVIVGQRRNSASWDKAVEDGWTEGETLFGIEEAARRGTILLYLLSDAGQIARWESVKSRLTAGKCLCFSHGFGVTYERGILMGALAGVFEAQFAVLRKNGHSPSEAFNETVEELTQSLMPLVAENGMDWMYRNCSTTAQRGALDWRHRFRDAVAPLFDELYERVRTGEEARIVIEECGRADYRERLEAELGEMADQEIWRAGKRLRQLRP